MAKKQTEGQGGKDIIDARGVGLKKSEWAELDAIAKEMEKKPHYIRANAVRYFLKQYRAGKIKPETKRTQTLPEL
jgi:hypothetical protein